jgi:hypothetical protein
MAIPAQPHDDEYTQDLHAEAEAGVHSRQPRHETVPAQDIKELHGHLPGFSNDELHRISVVKEGERLEQGAVYIDLMNPERGEITAMGEWEAGPGTAYVPKRLTDYLVWNRLIGITNPERLDQEPSGS